MPSKKGMEQTLLWLHNKMAEKDTLDSVNATVCYNVLMDLQRQREKLGAIYNQMRNELEDKKEQLYAIQTQIRIKNIAKYEDKI